MIILNKICLVFVIFLFLLPCVNAVISIEGLGKSVYNLGDNMEVKGYITRNEDDLGFLKINLNCENPIPVLTKSISLKKDTKKIIDENFVIPLFIQGDCTLGVVLEVDGDIVEEAVSDKFVISKDLKGSFVLSDKLVQLGKDIELKGEIYRLDGANVEGNAVIYFKKNDTLFNVNSASVQDGKLFFTISSVSYPSGGYNIEIEVVDTYGNQFTFTDIDTFTLVNEIYVFAKPEKVSVLPGIVLRIFGEAKTILQEKIDSAKVSIIFEGARYETDLEDSKFEYELVLPENTKSGRHDVEIIVEDSLGNIGRTTTNFDVNAIPTKLYTESEAKTYIPGTKIKFKPILLDQGEDFIIEDISVELIDTENNVKFSKVVKTNEFVEYEFESYALPGTWLINTYASGLLHEDQIYVGETLAANFSLDGQNLIISNIGNIIYRKPIQIKLEGEKTYSFIVKEKLEPGESYKVNLGKDVNTGVYNVLAGDKMFENVQISGFIERSYTWLYITLIVIVLLAILFFIIRKVLRQRREIIKKVEEEKHLAEKVKEFLSSKGLYKKEANKKPETKEERMQRYRNELKEQLLKDIDKREKKIRQDVSRFVPGERRDYMEIKKPARKDDAERKKIFRDMFSGKK